MTTTAADKKMKNKKLRLENNFKKLQTVVIIVCSPQAATQLFNNILNLNNFEILIKNCKLYKLPKRLSPYFFTFLKYYVCQIFTKPAPRHDIIYTVLFINFVILLQNFQQCNNMTQTNACYMSYYCKFASLSKEAKSTTKHKYNLRYILLHAGTERVK